MTTTTLGTTLRLGVLSGALAFVAACGNGGSSSAGSQITLPSNATIGGPSTSASPTTTSDGNAEKQAALKAFTDYWSQLDVVLEDGGASPFRIRPYARGQALGFAINLAGDFTVNHYKLVGASVLTNTVAKAVPRSTPKDIGHPVVTYRVTGCLDTHANHLSQNGKQLPPPAAPRYYPYTVTAVESPEGGRQTWTLDQFQQGKAVATCP